MALSNLVTKMFPNHLTGHLSVVFLLDSRNKGTKKIRFFLQSIIYCFWKAINYLLLFCAYSIQVRNIQIETLLYLTYSYIVENIDWSQRTYVDSHFQFLMKLLHFSNNMILNLRCFISFLYLLFLSWDR